MQPILIPNKDGTISQLTPAVNQFYDASGAPIQAYRLEILHATDIATQISEAQKTITAAQVIMTTLMAVQTSPAQDVSQVTPS